jgi:gliding motility-associated lipoprotein GldH
MYRLPAVFFLFVMMQYSCNADRVIYEEVYNIESGQWVYGQKRDFNFEVSDTSEEYRLLLYLEYNTDYRWQNFYTEITTTFPGDSVRKDIVSLELASKTGRWYGNCNSQSCSLTIPLQEDVHFEKSGNYGISFDQYMREEDVYGITAIGLKLVVPGHQ